jgi:ribosome-associated translation inhibitor RaiA
MDDDTVTLGGNIQLSGFKDIEPAQMIVLKKIIGTYARKFSNKCKKFELLKLSMKKVHEQEHSEKYEVHAMAVDEGKQYTSEVTERNLFFAIDTALKKVENEISK